MSQRISQTFEIVNRLGLHARAASRLVQLASRFPCDIFVYRDEQRANAKSVMGVLLLCAAPGCLVTIEAEGDQAELAVSALGAFIQDKMGEES